MIDLQAHMTESSLLILIAIALFASACGTPTRPAQPPSAARTISSEARAEQERSRVKKFREESADFDLLGRKMDEYQDLLALCDSISETDETKELKASCTARLKALHRELTDLSARLQDEE
jgi:hypothetical protein